MMDFEEQERVNLNQSLRGSEKGNVLEGKGNFRNIPMGGDTQLTRCPIVLGGGWGGGGGGGGGVGWGPRDTSNQGRQ